MKIIFWLFFTLFNIQLALADNITSANPPRESHAGFFILSDKSYGTTEQAQVRLEVQDVSAVHQNAGLDIAVYKVPNPIGFLQSQQNLHRLNLKAVPAEDGVWNSIIAIWDYITRQARQLVRGLFSEDARSSTVAIAPDLHINSDLKAGHALPQNAAYKPLVGFDLVARFRYPLQYGNDIKQADAVLDGANVEGDNFVDEESSNDNAENSSSEENTKAPAFSNGNVYIPIGKLAPGLYIVEAMLDEQRAVTMVFVGDTVAVTKTSPDGLLAWAVNRITGAPVENVVTHWTDGVGELASGKTNAQGWVQLNHAAPEQTYLYALDAQGGVLISENFYYDSEIYNTKLYATTDRPLYRAGDTVNIKVVGREFINAQTSKLLADAPIKLEVLDPNGLPVANQTFAFSGTLGGDTSIKLPSTSTAGGYDIRLTYLDEVYSAAFRVADFQKPHFEINVAVDNKNLKTKQTIPVQVQLRYPDGKPVKNAAVDIDLKAQALSMVTGDLGYGGQFPIKLTSKTYQSDGDGNVKLDLPEVAEPSRYVLSVLATDGAAYRVRHTQELLIARAESRWLLSGQNRFSNPNTAVHFNMQHAPLEDAATAPAINKVTRTPARWQWIRLEDQSEQSGDINSQQLQQGLDITFVKSGSYTVNILSDDGTLLGATSHWVSGADLKVPAGAIEIVWDKSSYQVGETATALLSFSENIDHALVTLERDKIENISLLSSPANWLSTKRIAPNQWRVSMPVTDLFAPNLTLSVAYVKNNEFVFENAGVLVSSPKVDVRVTANKSTYQPGETVKLSIDTSMILPNVHKAQPVSAQVSLGAVDEMIYVLQPEIAPNINEFFYHPRRNNVRTQYSQSFIGYDLSSNQLGQAPNSHHVQERATKLLERPRRDDVDTALWSPKITTDSNGHADISFTMPDSLTRWRLTARAMTTDGVVGQSINHILSDKDFYIKWTSPNWLRVGDSATSNLAVFNQTNQDAKVHLALQGVLTQDMDVTLKPGINFIDVPRTGEQKGDVTALLTQDSKTLDTLNISLNMRANSWLQRYSRLVSPQNNMLPLALPADASNITLRFLENSSAAFYRVADDLIEQPYGCAEQTSSRLIPLALVYQSLPDDDARKTSIARLLYTHRLRLASMAGDDAQFGWWGIGMTADPFITTYAYYADWHTVQALHLTLPSEHWESLSTLYSDSGYKLPLWQRALMLDWMQQMGLPIGSLSQALATDITTAKGLPNSKYGMGDSMVLSDASRQTVDMATVLTSKLLKETHQALPEGFSALFDSAVNRLQQQNNLLGNALLVHAGVSSLDAMALLSAASVENATIDRSLMLTWLAPEINHTVQTPVAASSAPPTVVTPPVATSTVAPTPTVPVAATSQNVVTTTPAPVVAASNNTPLPKEWKLLRSTTGNSFYRWTALATAPKPQSLNSNRNAVVSYDSAVVGKQHNLPAKLTRQLFILNKQEDGSFEADEVGNGDTVNTDALYLEKITLTPTKPLHYMIVEAALPAGAQVEPSTWGIKVNDMDALPRANFQEIAGRYVVPFGDISSETSTQQLLRFSQRGTYVLPPARAYNMYAPDQQALEANPRQRIKVK